MRFGLGLIGLLVVLAVIGVTVKKQLTVTQASLSAVVPTSQGTSAGGPAPTVPQQAQQIEQQVKQQVENLSQPRAMPDDAK